MSTQPEPANQTPRPAQNQKAMRYFIDTVEVSEADAFDAERRGTALVAQGGSHVVPESLRVPGETPQQYLRPWVLLHTAPASNGESRD